MYIQILEEYPQTKIADRIHYSRGECYYSLGEIEQALKEFNILIEEFPESEFAPLAKRKIEEIEKK